MFGKDPSTIGVKIMNAVDDADATSCKGKSSCNEVLDAIHIIYGRI